MEDGGEQRETEPPSSSCRSETAFAIIRDENGSYDRLRNFFNSNLFHKIIDFVSEVGINMRKGKNTTSELRVEG